MRSNSKHTTEEIERYILMYLNEGISFKELKEAGSFALIGAGFIYVLAFVLSIQNPLVFAILLIVAGIVMGYYTISMHAYVTDVIDDFYFKRGTRKDGTIYSVYSFTRKVGQAIAGLLAHVLLT